MDDVTTGEMLGAIAEEGGKDSLALIGNILDSNRREQEWLASTIQSSLERELDDWKQRALAAEERLHRIEGRLFGLLD
jgi:hypothetical protein